MFCRLKFSLPQYKSTLFFDANKKLYTHIVCLSRNWTEVKKKMACTLILLAHARCPDILIGLRNQRHRQLTPVRVSTAQTRKFT